MSDESSENELVAGLQYRHSVLRSSVREQAIALAQLREQGSRSAEKIYGIDAAASEFNTRPEVFASAYRFLKQHQPHSDGSIIHDFSKIPTLRATFHAGEDFYDIIDGLRTIDEAMKFLDLGQGDRLGHALALGIDVKDFYASKHRQFMIPRQVLLDNYSWLLSRMAKYGMHEFSSLQSKILHDFKLLFGKVYGHLKLTFDSIYYYQAWALRADEPSLYQTGKFEKKEAVSEFDCFTINTSYAKDVCREDHLVTDILVAYHYDYKVKKEGAEIKRFDISDEYIRAVVLIQKKMQEEVMQKHIAIECNPSSNVLIGTFKQYDKHPITNFFNLGLTYNDEELRKCPQLMVSINTDDQGVFNTYLENEYALMALALEKAKDENGKPKYNPSMIYDWLERVRQMGLEMSFKSRFDN